IYIMRCYMSKRILFRNLLIIFPLLLFSSPLRAGWSIQNVDSFGNAGEYSSIDYGPSTGVIHISYYETQLQLLRCAKRDGEYAAWDINTVDSGNNVGKYSSIQVDSNGLPHISYYDATDYNLKYASCTDWASNTWIISTIDQVGDVGKYCSLALDSSGYAHISYYDSDSLTLKHAWWNGSAWLTEVVDNDIGSTIVAASDIALDSSDRPHITYYHSTNYELKYASWTGTAWSTSTVDSLSNVGRHNSLALDSSDYAHISYYDFNNTLLKYAKWNGTGWDIQTIDASGNVGQYTSIATDSSDYPHISYYDVGNSDLKYALWDGTGWTVEQVDTLYDAGRYSSIALDYSDMPLISYREATNKYLKFATRDIVPPSAVTDLTAATGLKTGEIDLFWTAPGDDGTKGNNLSGAAYTLKYATYSVAGDTQAWWNNPDTLTYTQSWSVAQQGNQESYTVTLSSGTTYYFALKTTDEAGNQSSIDEQALAVQASAVAKVPVYPVSNVVIPVNSAYYNNLSSITGTATDSDGSVVKVEISIYDQDTSAYWDGGSWVVSESWLLSTGTATWTYNSGSVSWTSTHTYTVKSMATDNANNTESPGAGNSFIFNDLPPTSSVDIPVHNETYNSLALIQGTAADVAGGLDFVMIKIMRSSDSRYWSDSGWISFETWHLATGTSTWNYNTSTVTWTSGQLYVVYSSATDKVGNIQTQPAANTFRFDTGKPVSLITVPVDGGAYNTSFTISGTAKDSDGTLSEVRIKIENTTDSTFWDGGAWQLGEWWSLASGLTSWTYDSPPWEDGKEYRIWSRAKDNASPTKNTEDVGAGTTFLFDTTPPTSKVVLPADGGSYSVLETISGTGYDSTSSITWIKISIKDMEADRYW
ncbi:MAG: hypothetical protein DRI01_10665, partial [Chloroflexi bacterium]